MDAKKIRRHDLDWLRVMVFGLLIIYHVGMFFVNWDWHLKNNVINYDLGWPMAFINRWRLHILFVISGMGTYYAFSYRTTKQFVLERIKRLGIPLIIGMLLIVPPQMYYEMLSKKEFSGSYFSFLTSSAYIDYLKDLNWHHLWFLPYLLLYSLILAPVFNYIIKNPNNKFINFIKQNIEKNPWKLFLFTFPLWLYEGFLEPFFPKTHDIIGDWFLLMNYGTLFFFGFILIALKDVFWKALDKIKYITLITAIIAFTIQVYLYDLEDSWPKHLFEAYIYVLNTWSWILTIFGFAAKYRNKKSKWLSYANRAVYPFYILHQTILIILAYYVKDLNWSFTIKFSYLIIGTFSICWIIYHFLILKIKVIHPLFGLKKSKI